MSTSNDRDVIIIYECIWKIHIGETGHIYTSSIVYENHSQG